jgi:hypothetical protein
MSKAHKFILSFLFAVFISLLTILLIPERFLSHAETVIEIYTIEDLNNVRNDLTAHYVLMNDLDFENPASWNDHATNYDIVMNGVTTIEDERVGNANFNTYFVSLVPIDDTAPVTVKVRDIERDPYEAGVTGGWEIDYVTGQIQFKDADGVLRTPAVLYSVHSTTSFVDVTYTLVEKGYYGWLPIGESSARFSGIFDGNANTISNLYINRRLLPNVGLFGYVNGTIRNIGVEDVNIRGLQNIGGLVGYLSSGTITTSYSTGSLVSAHATLGYIGGLVGITGFTSLITNSYSTADVTGVGHIGGFIGRIATTRVMNCYSTGLLPTSGTNRGGFNGSSTSATVVNSFWDTTTSGMTTSNQGTGRTTAQMQSLANYSGLWSIVDSSEPTRYVWYIEDGVGYPKLHNSIHSTTLLTKVGEYNLVGSVADLRIVNEYSTVPGFKYKLTSHLDLVSDPGFYIPYFIGEFDGDGYAISNLSLDMTSVNYVGLFGQVHAGSLITNLGLLNVNVSGANYVGAISGYAAGITNCYVTGSITSTGTQVGVFQGWTFWVSENSYYNYEATTLNGQQVFGLSALDQARFDDWIAGGFVPLDISTYLTQENEYYLINSVSDLEALRNFGQEDDLKVKLTTNLDLTPSPGVYIPNFHGEFDGSGYTISNLSLDISTQDKVGLFGNLRGGSILYDLGVTNATVVGQDDVGILVGYATASRIWNTYTSGTVTGRDYVGSLVGRTADWYGEVYDSYSLGTVSGRANVGGLIGRVSGSTKVLFSHSSANVTGTTFPTGGLVGYNAGLINVTYSTGSVEGSSYVGGLVGQNFSGTILDSYSHSPVNVTTSGQTGAGLIGRVEGSGSRVDRTYSTGAVTCTGTTTGLRGLISSYSAGTITNSFWDTETSGRTTSNGGTGKTTVEMKALATYSDTATVGLDTPWVINPYY